MKLFTRKGIFFLPSSVAAWLLTLLFAGFLVWRFFDIDSRSHSASDTLINFFFSALVILAVYAVVGFFTSEGKKE